MAQPAYFLLAKIAIMSKISNFIITNIKRRKCYRQRQIVIEILILASADAETQNIETSDFQVRFLESVNCSLWLIKQPGEFATKL